MGSVVLDLRDQRRISHETRFCLAQDDGRLQDEGSVIVFVHDVTSVSSDLAHRDPAAFVQLNHDISTHRHQVTPTYPFGAITQLP